MVEFNPKLAEPDPESLADETERAREGRHPTSAFQGIFCPVLAVIMTIAIVLILSFAWRSCVP